jgi:hypothetical protein
MAAFHRHCPEDSLSLRQDKAILEALNADIQRLWQDTQDKNQADCIAAQRRIDRLNRFAFLRASRGVDSAVGALTSLKGSAALAYLTVKDRIHDTVEADARMNRILREHVLNDLTDSFGQIETVIAGLKDTLEVNQTEMIVQLAQAFQEAKVADGEFLASALKGFTSQLLEKKPIVGKIALSSTASVGGIGASAVFAKQSLQQLKKVIQYIVKRFLKTQAISGALAAADGPVPLGDAIALVVEVGGTGLCVYELYKARRELKPQLKAAILDDLNRLQIGLEGDARKYCRNLQDAYEQAEKDTIRTLVAQLN